MSVHGELWTIKEFFTYPNEFVYWSVQIVLYPYMTGLVAGSFVLSSLYHVFDRKELKDIAGFSLLFSFALLAVAMMPLMLHLQQPLRGFNVFFTPHFTSAIAAFGIVFSSYQMLVAAEIWFLKRKFFIESAQSFKGSDNIIDKGRYYLYHALTLGAYDISEETMEYDRKIVRFLAGLGIPVAAFLHGYAGFIFGSVKANALWMTPLMPVIFIMSAIVSGIALCIVTYVAFVAIQRYWAEYVHKKTKPGQPLPVTKKVELAGIKKSTEFLVMFMILAITLELLDLVFRGYTAMKQWDILRAVIYERDFVNIFIIQYFLGNLVPLVMLLVPGLTIRRSVYASLLVLLGVFMMRWNVVIGGQSFSSTLSGFMHYELPLMPHDFETAKEGLVGVIFIFIMPFILLYGTHLIIPVTGGKLMRIKDKRDTHPMHPGSAGPDSGSAGPGAAGSGPSATGSE